MSACSGAGAYLAALYPEVEACCVAHDQAYARGGDARARLIADVQFFLALLTTTPVPALLCALAFDAVRIFGGWGHHWPGGEGWLEAPAGPERGEGGQQP